MPKHAQYVAEPLNFNGEIIRRTYVSDHNALASPNCLRKYARPRKHYTVYRINANLTHTVIFRGVLHV